MHRNGANFDGEFDPGSGTTLAACLMHASRMGPTEVDDHGGRVSNTWRTCPLAGDNPGKPGLIPHTLAHREGVQGKASLRSLVEGSATYQLDGGVMAYHGDDG